MEGRERKAKCGHTHTQKKKQKNKKELNFKINSKLENQQGNIYKLKNWGEIYNMKWQE